jgi:outer membrane protein OmpA-like peptidoglycan-associated protein
MRVLTLPVLLALALRLIGIGNFPLNSRAKEREGAMHRKTIAVSLMTLFFLTSLFAFAADKVKGMIITRTGETLIVKSGDEKTTVVLTDSTRTKDDTGLFGLGKNEMSNVVLIPGLKVSVDGASDEQGRFVAKTITVDGDDLETAEMIQSGLHPTAQQVAANVQKLEAHGGQLSSHEAQLAAQRETLEAHGMSVADHEQRISQSMKDIEENSNRFSLLSDYDVKGQASVKFGVGQSALTADDKQALQQIAQTATSLSGYIVEVTGYADSTGSAAMNTKLSEDRAKAVIAFLMQQGGVPVRHIVAPGAMGEYGAAASNETKAGRAENRRVEVKILVNKGITGS